MVVMDMKWLTGMLLVWMLARTELAMQAASEACRLFVTSVMPGLLPYMALMQWLISRTGGRLPALAVTAMGWGGGSPTGALLLQSARDADGRTARRIAVSCQTMSPMFLAGTLGGWLRSPVAGWCILAGVIAGGCVTGCLAVRGSMTMLTVSHDPIRLGDAIERTMRTMLLICGTMAVMRMAAAMAYDVLHSYPLLALAVTTLLEVTTGANVIAALPCPLALRTALLAAATAFGGASVVLQNHALLPEGLLSLPAQVMWQAVHAALSFLIALGLALLVL